MTIYTGNGQSELVPSLLSVFVVCVVSDFVNMSASFSFSTDELAAIAVSLEDEEKQKRRRWSVHPAWLTREKEGEFKIYKELVDYDDKFHAYFRMSKYSFTVLLDKVSPVIEKQNTNWKIPISARERLAVCLR